jgi:hypothetical protein
LVILFISALFSGSVSSSAYIAQNVRLNNGLEMMWKKEVIAEEEGVKNVLLLSVFQLKFK